MAPRDLNELFDAFELDPATHPEIVLANVDADGIFSESLEIPWEFEKLVEFAKNREKSEIKWDYKLIN